MKVGFCCCGKANVSTGAHNETRVYAVKTPVNSVHVCCQTKPPSGPWRQSIFQVVKNTVCRSNRQQPFSWSMPPLAKKTTEVLFWCIENVSGGAAFMSEAWGVRFSTSAWSGTKFPVRCGLRKESYFSLLSMSSECDQRCAGQSQVYLICEFQLPPCKFVVGKIKFFSTAFAAYRCKECMLQSS